MTPILVRNNAEWLDLRSQWNTPDRIWEFAPGEYDQIKFVGAPNVEIRAADPNNWPVVTCLEADGDKKKQGIWAIDCDSFRADRFVVKNATENGVLVSGTDRYVSGVALTNLRVHDIGSASGNHDAIKLTHLADFLVEGADVSPAAKAHAFGNKGSGIDMVSCRNGVIQNNRFKNNLLTTTSGQGIQMKGGSHDILVRRNYLFGCGRGIAFGGGQDKGVTGHLPLPTELPVPSAHHIRAIENVLESCGSGLWFQNAQDCLAEWNAIFDPATAITLWHSTESADMDTFKRLTIRYNVFVHRLARKDVIKHAVPKVGDGTDEINYEGNWWFNSIGDPWPIYPGRPTITGEVYGVDPLVLTADWPHALPSSSGSLPYPSDGPTNPPTDPPTQPPAGRLSYRLAGLRFEPTGIFVDLEGT